ncbi:MAG TPA: glycosyltransferase [Solirubrobacterales bacterium]|nr:glycosyltransferase [Solirubrobacterales bacterium]
MNLLLVAYFFPPCRDTGAHRPAAMAKWLRRLGHSVTVLTTSAYGAGEGASEEDVVRTFDLQRLRARLRGHDRVDALFDADTYAGGAHPLSKALVPEPLIAAWAPFARSRALRLNRRRRFDCVITSSPPESAHAVGRALARRGVAWVADLRDAWTFEPIRPRFPTALQRRLDQRLEGRWLSAADAVVCVSHPVADDLRRRLGIEASLVPNGWDPDLVEEREPPGERREPRPDGRAASIIDPERVSLVYTGRFGSYGRDPGPLVSALGDLARTEPELASRLELVVAGPLTDAEAGLMETDVSPARIVVAGSLPREQALALQRAADALLLIASPRRTQLLNFKVFEYLASGRPMLALAAGTEAGRVVEEAGGTAVPADDVAAIVGGLQRLARGELKAPTAGMSSAYSYPHVAERMAEVAAGAVAVARTRRRPYP